MIEDGEEIPSPSSLDDLAKDPARKGAFAFLVAVEAPQRTVRINITARTVELAEIDRRAKRAGLGVLGAVGAWCPRRAGTPSAVIEKGLLALTGGFEAALRPRRAVGERDGDEQGSGLAGKQDVRTHGDLVAHLNGRLLPAGAL